MQSVTGGPIAIALQLRKRLGSRVNLAGLWLCAVAFPGTTTPGQAQVVRGHIVDPAAGVGVGGAMVTLVSPDGGEAGRVITSAGDGSFLLHAPAIGEYRLRADRIGYAATYSEFFFLAAGDTLVVSMVANIEPVSLAGIEAEAGRRCRVRPEEGLAVSRVWEEARKALAAAVWTQEQGEYEYEMLRITRDMDPRGRTVVGEDRMHVRSRGQASFLSRPADSLVYAGFARFSDNMSQFWAPDAAVLLSNPFLDTHCLRVRTGDGAATGLVGLEFEPTRDRGVPDIAGTVWLDPSTAEMRWVDFRYRYLGVSRELERTSPGGRVEFARLPNGAWIVTSWHVRMFLPRVTDVVSVFRIVMLEGIREERGKVLRVLADESVVYRGGLGYRVAGAVLDTLGVGLPNARVFIEGSGAEATTDAQGRFELAHLEPGEYVLHFGHPYLDQLWFRPRPERVGVRENDTVPVEVQFRASPLERVFDQICDGEERPSMPQEGLRMHGIVMGQVSDDNGQPAVNAEVVVLAQAVTDVLQEATEWVAVTAPTDPSGFYRACWVPIGVPLSVVVLHENEEFDPEDLVGNMAPADLLPGRVQNITIVPEQPYQTIHLRFSASRHPQTDTS